MNAKMSLVWLAMLKALEKSITMVNVWSGAQRLLKPCAILCVRGRRTETVEWLGRKSCWLDERGSEFSSGFVIFVSNTNFQQAQDMVNLICGLKSDIFDLQNAKKLTIY